MRECSGTAARIDARCLVRGATQLERGGEHLAELDRLGCGLSSPRNQDRSLAPSSTPGASAIQTDLMRPFSGYGAITQRADTGWRTYHSIQLSLQRRFTRGLSLGFTDAIQLVDKQGTALRLQHAPDGTISIMADQAKADALLGDNSPSTHFMRANFVWDMPDLHQTQGIGRALGHSANDWQLSGLWNGSTSAAYTIGYSYQNGAGPVNLTGSPDFLGPCARSRRSGSRVHKQPAQAVQHGPRLRVRWSAVTVSSRATITFAGASPAHWIFQSRAISGSVAAARFSSALTCSTRPIPQSLPGVRRR
jgi:hypothetical protein